MMNDSDVKTSTEITDLASYRTRKETAASKENKNIKMSVVAPTSAPGARDNEFIATICKYIVTYIEVKLDLIILMASIDSIPVLSTLSEFQRETMYLKIMEKCMEHIFTDVDLMDLLGTEQFIINLDDKITKFIISQLQDARSLL